MLRPGGQLAFCTIFIPPGLSEADYRRALRMGPAGAASRRRGQGNLLRSAGFVEVSETDLTAEFLRIARAWLEARERHADTLSRLRGGEFAQMQAEARQTVVAIEAGLLRRSLLVARRPP